MTSNRPTRGACCCCGISLPLIRPCGCLSSGPIATANCLAPTRSPTPWRRFAGQSGVSRIELTGLDDNDVLAYIEATAGQALDDAGVGLAHAVYRETDGNPYFVSEVLREVRRDRAIFQDGTGRSAC